MTALSEQESPRAVAALPARSATPERWGELWATPAIASQRVSLLRLKRLSRRLADDIELRDASPTFGSLVGSDELRTTPVHRWFAYKEGFSPKLLGTVIDALDTGHQGNLRVADAFGGVATA